MRTAAVAAGFMILLAACAEVASSVGDGPTDVIGFENVFSNAESWTAWNDARLRAETVVGECMAGAGFDYVEWTNSADDVRYRAYALTDDELDFATEFGFGLAALESEAQRSGFRQERPDPRNYTGLSSAEIEAFDVAFLGVEDEEGCQWAGDAEQIAVGFEIVVGIDDLRSRRSQFLTDPGVAEHYVDWSICMSTRGFDHPSPAHVFVAFEERSIDVLSSDDASAIADLVSQEIAAATATVECGEPVRQLLPEELRELWEIHAAT
ncbi:MAG: hypothetical protein ACR2P0_02560 [Acidimicrobiales bacterium]